MEKLEPLHSAGRNVKWYSHCRKVMWFLKNVKHRILILPSIFTSWYITPKNWKPNKTQSNKTQSQKFTATLFTIIKRWKQPKRSSTDKWINKMWYGHTTEYYSVIKKEWSNDTGYTDESQKHYTKWKKSNSNGHKLYVIPFIWNIQNR